MNENSDIYSLAFCKIAELAEKLGIRSINELPGCWEQDLPNGWRFHVNGHDKPIEDSRGCVVPAFQASIWKGDDFAGFVHPAGGVLIGMGMLPEQIEDAFIDALDEALKAICENCKKTDPQVNTCGLCFKVFCLESRPLKTRPHSAPTGAAFGFCYAPPLARNSESTND